MGKRRPKIGHMIVAKFFKGGAYEEAARVKKEGQDVRLVEVDDLLRGKFKVRGLIIQNDY